MYRFLKVNNTNQIENIVNVHYVMCPCNKDASHHFVPKKPQLHEFFNSKEIDLTNGENYMLFDMLKLKRNF